MRRAVSLCGVAIFFALFSFPLNAWFSLTMLRHQIIQLPAMFILGAIAGAVLYPPRFKNRSLKIALLIATMATLIFWMLPRSIDLTIVYPWFNRVMHGSIFIAGAGTVWGLRGNFFEAQIAFPLMLAAMLITGGAALRSFTILLCSSFTLADQQATGFYLLCIGALIFIGTITFLLQRLGATASESAYPRQS
ncbi:MAG: hypothetical protein JSR44_16435 [Spirochaetes bacterium]|nr:hypothetical protein [Spirochaetota bacterium]